MTNLLRNRHLLAATLLTLATTAQLAPAQERHISAVLIVRCGSSDIVLNQHLLEALLSEPGLVKRFKDGFGDAFQSIERTVVEMPASHGVGTYQVHLHCSATIRGVWTAETRKKTTMVFVDHLRSRLDDLLYEEPLTQLSKRRDMLRQMHLNTSSRLLEVNKKMTRSKDREGLANNQFTAIQQQLLAAKLEVATEEHVRKYLATSRDKNVAMRDDLSKTIRKAEHERTEIENDLRALASRRAEASSKEESAKLTDKINRVTGQLDQVNNGLARWRELANDVRNMLTIILEQLPSSELKLQRAKASLSSLEHTLEELTAQQDDAQALAKKNAKLGLSAEHLTIDSQVTRAQLLDIEAQLARIQPVRYQVLPTR